MMRANLRRGSQSDQLSTTASGQIIINVSVHARQRELDLLDRPVPRRSADDHQASPSAPGSPATVERREVHVGELATSSSAMNAGVGVEA